MSRSLRRQQEKRLAAAVPCRYCGRQPEEASVACEIFLNGVGYFLQCRDMRCPGSYLNFIASSRNGALLSWNEMNERNA